MVTVYVSIGNSDDKLGQAEWSRFWVETDSLIQVKAERVHGQWLSSPTAPFQNACWCFAVALTNVRALRLGLTRLAIRYRQNSIAWAAAEEDFVLGE